MARSTQVLKTGLQILTGTDVPIYSLEYLDTTKLHQAGQYEKIVVPYVEIGRDSSCVVRFDDDSPLVSRKHAAIVRDNNGFVLKHLSKTNSTYLNGSSINTEAVLKNGDEIKLSAEGPRVRFNTTSTGTAKLGFTNRMNLVIQQAVRPYKATMAAFSIIFILSISGLVFLLQDTQTKLDEQIALTDSKINEIRAINTENAEFMAVFQENEKKFQSELGRLKRRLKENEEKEVIPISPETRDSVARQIAELEELPEVRSSIFADYVAQIEPYVMAIFIEGYKISFNGETIEEQNFEEPQCMCTGFLIETGQFVTARHCVDLFMDDENGVKNFLINSGGEIQINFSAKSIDSRLNFDFKNTDLAYDISRDLKYRAENEGLIGAYRKQNFFNGTDWAIFQTTFSEGLSFAGSESSNLTTSQELFIMGFPDGMRFRNDDSLKPDFNKGIVRRGGLINGVIHGVQGAERGGNSGGPVFTFLNGSLQTVGIVTGAIRDDEGREIHQVYTPMSNITSIQ